MSPTGSIGGQTFPVPSGVRTAEKAVTVEPLEKEVC